MTRATLRGLVLVALYAAVATAGEKKITETIKDKEGKPHSFDMVLIPAGSFTIGSPEDEEDREEHEGPQHTVKIKPFYMATTETTFEMFMAYYEETVQEKRDPNKKKPDPKKVDPKKVDAISGPTPLYGDPTMGWGAGKQPVMGTSWINAVTYCKWLSKKTGKKYRLPTEAEWEYACRAGTKTPYWFGDDPDDIEDHDWYEDNADEQTHEVASLKPNPFGLYDMHGNVREWCSDFYSATTYGESAKTNPVDNPTGPAKGKVHVARGGAYDSPLEECRSATRIFQEEWWQAEDPQEPKSVWWLPKMAFIGFRVVCEAE